MITKILAQIENFKNHVEQATLCNTNISTVSVGWHVEHSVEVIINTAKLLAKSNPEEYKPTFSLPKLIVLTTGKIPRGKAKAPASVCPSVVADKTLLLQKIDGATIALQSIQNLPANHFFKHPFFGHLNVKSYNKFLFIHGHHHLKIINDLIKH